MMSQTIRAAALLALACGIAVPQTASKADEEVKQAEQAWVKAITSNDDAALDRLVSPRLVYTHSTGLVEDKAAYRKALATFQKYTAVDYESMRVNVFGGDAAVINSKVRMRGSTKDTPFDNRLMLIHVWVKEGGRWQLAAHQTTRLP